jgi:hypothetical protein
MNKAVDESKPQLSSKTSSSDSLPTPQNDSPKSASGTIG